MKSIILYNGANSLSLPINPAVSKELGLHCGTTGKQAKWFMETRGYSHAYRLVVRPTKILDVEDTDDWVGADFVHKLEAALDKSLFSQFRAVSCDPYSRGEFLRNIILGEGYDVLRYINRVEVNEPCYIVLDPNCVVNIEDVTEQILAEYPHQVSKQTK